MLRPLFLIGAGIFGLVGLFTLYLGVLYFRVPDVTAMKGCLKTSMFEVDLCPTKSSYVRLYSISPYLRHAVIVSEDVSFYSHRGFDLSEIKASFERNLDRGSLARGGSTITQQLAKNVFLSSEKTFTRKLLEARITQEIEKNFTKDQILERYLNIVQFGEKLFGVRSASQFYFGKHPSELNVLEASFLTMLLPNPVKYSVSFRKKTLTAFARGRILDILFKMKHFEKVSEREYLVAKHNIDAFPWDGSKGPWVDSIDQVGGSEDSAPSEESD